MIVLALGCTVNVFNERVTHLRDGLQMMGLTDAAFYATIYVWYGLWCCFPAILGTSLHLGVPSMFPAFYPLGSKSRRALALAVTTQISRYSSSIQRANL